MSQRSATTLTTRPAMTRLLQPESIAIVGVGENSPYAVNARATLAGSSARVHFVHPRYEQVFEQTCYPSLAAIGEPIDCVFTATSAGRTLDVAREAAEIGAGGLVTIAGGFAEVGGAGIELQRELRAVANEAGMHVVGPNGIGLINVPAGISLTMLAPFERRAGGVSAVTHSGAMIEAIGAAAYRAGGIGLNVMISAGNEAVSDMADYLEYLVDDDATRVIVLAIEKIRRPDAFFAAAGRALAAGKPIVAIKLGRSARSQRMAASHTGSLIGDAWVYDVAFRQAGILLADDIDDLVDRVQFLERLPREKWTPVKGLAVLTATGGFAQLASDLAERESLDIPELTQIEPFVRENIPGGTVANPLDATGFVSSIPGLWEKVVRRYEQDDEVDSLILLSQQADWDIANRGMSDTFAEVAATSSKPFVVAPLAGLPGRFMSEYEASGVAVGNGLRGCLRGLGTMGAFVATRKDSRVQPAASLGATARPTGETQAVPEGRMLGFADSMALIESVGIPVAPYVVVTEPGAPAPSFAGPYVVKLADVAHRTEHNAVRVKVAAEDLASVIGELQQIAATDGLPSAVAIQAMADGIGEAFMGIQGSSELGPVVAFGLGGVFVEVLRRVAGRMAPFERADADELIAELNDLGVLDGVRGKPAWPREALAKALVAAGELAARGRGWIDSIDLNPLIVTQDGVVAVDALCLLKD